MNTKDLVLTIFSGLDKIDKVFPELQFTPSNNGYRSKSYLDLDGGIGQHQGKITLPATIKGDVNEGSLYCHGTKKFKNIFEYLKEKHGLKSIDEAKHYAANKIAATYSANSEGRTIKATNSNHTAVVPDILLNDNGIPNNVDLYHHKLYELFEPIIKLARTNISQNPTGLTIVKDRCFDLKDHHVRNSNIGLVGNDERQQLQADLVKRMRADDYWLKYWQEYNKTRRHHQAGYHNRCPFSILNLNSIVFILYNIQGQFMGFTSRHSYLDGNREATYGFNIGFNKLDNLFSIKPINKQKEIIICEGFFDYTLAQVMGFTNVIGNGTALNFENSTQLKKLKEYTDLDTLILCPDNERIVVDGRHQFRWIHAIRKTQKVCEDLKVELKVLQIPTKDIADLLKQKDGIAKLNECIINALPYWQFEIANAFETSHDSIQAVKSTIGRLELNRFEQKDGFDTFINDTVNRSNNIGFDYNNEVNNILLQKEIQSYNQTLKGQLDKVKKNVGLTNEDKEFKELETLRTNSPKKYFKLRDSQPLSLEGYKELVNNTPDDLAIGFSDGKDEIELPVGGITVIAARTGHCKTTVLIQSVINTISKLKDNERILYLHYEENKLDIESKFMSCYLDVDLNSDGKTNNIRAFKDLLKYGKSKYIWGGICKEGLMDEINKYFTDIRPKLIIEKVNFNNAVLLNELNNLKDIKLVVIDYVQLIDVDDHSITKPRTYQLKSIVGNIEELAASNNIPVLLGAQSNKLADNILGLTGDNIADSDSILKGASLVYIQLLSSNVPWFRLPKDKDIFKATCELFKVPIDLYTNELKGKGDKVSYEVDYRTESRQRVKDWCYDNPRLAMIRDKYRPGNNSPELVMSKFYPGIGSLEVINMDRQITGDVDNNEEIPF